MLSTMQSPAFDVRLSSSARRRSLAVRKTECSKIKRCVNPDSPTATAVVLVIFSLFTSASNQSQSLTFSYSTRFQGLLTENQQLKSRKYIKPFYWKKMYKNVNIYNTNLSKLNPVLALKRLRKFYEWVVWRRSYHDFVHCQLVKLLLEIQRAVLAVTPLFLFVFEIIYFNRWRNIFWSRAFLISLYY